MLVGKREAQQRSAHGLVRYRAAIVRALDDLEARADDLAGPPTLGQIAVGCALGYLDFRKVGEAWRSGRPGLSAWYEQFSKRPSMQAAVAKRSEERRVGKERVSTCRSRWSKSN